MGAASLIPKHVRSQQTNRYPLRALEPIAPKSPRAQSSLGQAAPEGSDLRAIDDRRFHGLALGIGLGTVALLVLYVIRHGVTAFWGLAWAAPTVFFSKLTIFSGAAEQVSFSPWGLGLIAWVLDLLACTLLLAGVKGLDNLPVMGPAIVQARSRAADALRVYPGLRRLAIWGIFAFVFAPLPGSGSVVGTLISQIIGLSRTTALLAVGSGAGLAVVVYAWLADRIGEHGRDLLESPETIAAIALGGVLAGYLALRYIKRVLSQA